MQHEDLPAEARLRQPRRQPSRRRRTVVYLKKSFRISVVKVHPSRRVGRNFNQAVRRFERHRAPCWLERWRRCLNGSDIGDACVPPSDGLALLALMIKRILVHSKKACEDKLQKSHGHKRRGQRVERRGPTPVLEKREEGGDRVALACGDRGEKCEDM